MNGSLVQELISSDDDCDGEFPTGKFDERGLSRKRMRAICYEQIGFT